MLNNVIWNYKNTDIKSYYCDIYSFDLEIFSTFFTNNLNSERNYSFLVRIEYDQDKYRMAGNQIGFSLKNDNLKELYNKILDRIYTCNENYHSFDISSIQILYTEVNILPNLSKNNIQNLSLPSKLFDVRDIKRKFKSNLLPLTTDTRYFGKLIEFKDYENIISRINSHNQILNKKSVDINSFDNIFLYNNFYILDKHLGDNKYLRNIYDSKLGCLEASFTDLVIDDNKFIRTYNSTSFVVKNNLLSELKVEKTLPIIKKPKRQSNIISDPRIGTFDLETFKDSDGYGKVYAAGFCVLNETPVTFYMDKSSDLDVLTLCINNMLCHKYNGYKFYIHNLNFDGVFILYKLNLINLLRGTDLYSIKPFFRDNNILKIEIAILDENKKPKYKITFFDSAKLLTGSLHNLCKAFSLKTDLSKSYFPHNFVSRETLNYKGTTPSYNYWPNTPREEYDKLYSDNWNLKQECLTYLNLDLLSLLEILDLFNKYVTRKFDSQMTNCLTISRLSLNIFLSHYLKDSKIPIIKGNMYNDIKQAYFGGVTEVYKPYGQNLYYYDVNSLYPFVSLNPMCGNKYTYIESFDNNYLDLNNLFGFFYCEIETSDNYLGLLPLRKKEGLLMPNGKWFGWYFSEELKFAAENNYKIKVIKGYNFNKEYDVFKNYVDNLYKIKSITKNDVERTVAKSLLNNLLGRFGMNINKPITEIVNKQQLDILLATRELNSFSQITENIYLVSFNPKISKDICETHGYDYIKVLKELNINMDSNDEFKDISLVISAAITSYARVYMSSIKLGILNKGGNIYYTDTDSIVTDKPLDSNLVGSEIGLFKLEHKIKEGYFISAKTYALSVYNDKKPYVIKVKGILKESVTYKMFEDAYKGIDIKGTKRMAVTTYNKGSVIIDDKTITLNHNSYRKREKIYKRNKWIDTKPLYINDIDIDKDSKDSKSKKRYSILKNQSFNKNILNFIIKFVSNTLLFIISVILVTLVFDSFENTNIINELDTKSININYKNKLDIKPYTNKKSIVNNYFNKYININNSRTIYINNIYQNLWHDIISHNITTKGSLDNMENIIDYSKELLINKCKKGEVNITITEFINIIETIGNEKYNNKDLYNMVINEHSRYSNKYRYNIVNKRYMSKYTKWVNNPHVNKIPEGHLIKNKRSLLEEIKCIDNILSEYNNIQKNMSLYNFIVV